MATFKFDERSRVDEQKPELISLGFIEISRHFMSSLGITYLLSSVERSRNNNVMCIKNIISSYKKELD